MRQQPLITFVLFSTIILINLINLSYATVHLVSPKTLRFVPFTESNQHQSRPLDWWETSSFYQIYPRSFKDSNGDGIGDLNGITSKLDYLKEIGITGFWLSPIFRSPMADFGYDISDFFDIQPEYGTLQDFDRLVARAHELGLKVILDFVPNHSSDENDWFKKSAERDPEYEDFYVWHSGKPDPNNPGKTLPPTNWISVFRFSAWTWNDQRQQYYLHQFHHKQPDLNYRNPKVVERMKSVLTFWLDRGVSGFRIDAVPHLFEVRPDENGNFPDEPLSGNTNDPNDWGYLNHIYTTNQDETLDMVYQWRALLDEYQIFNGGDTRIMMTEAYTSIETTMKYYTNGTVNGSHIPFNFYLITDLHNNSNAYDFKRVTDIWMNNMPKGFSPNWVLGNHDNNRVGSRMGADRIDMMNMVLLTLPGASVTYNGEELGMFDVWISWKDTVDPQACNTNPNDYWKVSRDPERTPFQWDNTTSAGFSTNPKTWLPISSDYQTVNVANEDDSRIRSHLEVYKALMKLRQEETFQHGSLETQALNQNIFAIVRKLPSVDTFITLINIWDNQESVDISTFVSSGEDATYEVLSGNSKHEIGSVVKDPKNVILLPKESFVLRIPTKVFDYEYFKYKISNILVKLIP